MEPEVMSAGSCVEPVFPSVSRLVAYIGGGLLHPRLGCRGLCWCPLPCVSNVGDVGGCVAAVLLCDLPRLASSAFVGWGRALPGRLGPCVLASALP